MVEGALTGLVAAVRGGAAAREALSRRLGVPVLQAADGEGEVSFDEAVLKWPMQRADPAMHRFFADHVSARLPTVGLDDVVTRVVPLVDARLTAGDLRAEALARVLAVSIRTLQRRLREAGLTLRGLVAQRRLRRAQALLAAGRSPSEAALGAGYAEASSLHRALRRAKVDLGHHDGVRSGSQGGEPG